MFWNSKPKNNDNKNSKQKKNILTDLDVIKITLTYQLQGLKKRENAVLRFLSEKECYFSSQMSVIKPKPKTEILVSVYTHAGVYKSVVILKEVIDNVNERFLSVTIPDIWKLSQMRISSRVIVNLPVKIKYIDGLEISAISNDISLGGVCFSIPQEIPPLYRQTQAIFMLKLPNNTEPNFIRGFLACEAKFQREKLDSNYSQSMEGNTYVYRFLTMTNDDILVLKAYIDKINKTQNEA